MFRPLLITMLSTSLAVSAVHATEPAKTLTMTPVTVRDPMVNNIVAGSFLKPEGWKFTGGVKWYADMYHQADFEAKIYNPNTKEQLEILPIATACHLRNSIMPIKRLSNYMGSIVLEPMAPHQLVTEFTLPTIRKITPRSIKHYDMPELAKICAGGSSEPTWKVSRTRVSYVHEGTPVEEDFYVGCYYFREFNLGVNNSTTTIWGIAFAFGIRAEQGKLDDATPTMLAIVHSMRGTREHLEQVEYVKSLFCQRMMIGIKGAGDVSRTISANNDRALQLMREARASSDASWNHINKQFSDYIRGTQEYTHAGTSYSLPNHYQNAWVNTNGTILLSNSAGFDPNTTNSGNWNLLTPVR